MCPIVFLTFLFSLGVLLFDLINAFNVTFKPNQVFLKQGQSQLVNYTIVDCLQFKNNTLIYIPQVDDIKIAKVINQSNINIKLLHFSAFNCSYFTYSSNFTLVGLKFGHTNLFFNSKIDSLEPYNLNSLKKSNHVNNRLDVVVTLNKSFSSKIFTISVIILVSLNHINLGCAMDLNIIKSVLKKPTAPALGFVSQYIFMPLLSYIAGYYIFGKNKTYYRFGLFAFGCSPGGSASNIWTVLLDGNLDLSLTMTFISTCAALFMIPLWVMTLGSNIIKISSVPYNDILRSLVVMSFFLGIGLLMQKYTPKFAKICRKILVPASISVITIIIIFGTITYWLYIQLVNWKILLAAALNVWLGFLFGLILALLFKFSKKDIIAISIETGLQNTGISIFLIHLSLNSPESDLAFIVPITASLLTPIPLTIYYLMQKLYSCLNLKHSIKLKNNFKDQCFPIIDNGVTALINNQTQKTNLNYKSNENISKY